MKKPIVFLNIDGVLISEEYILSNANNLDKLYYQMNNNYYMNFEQEKILLLKELLKKTNASIVIVSSWCERNDLNQLISIFEKYGIKNKIVDIIPFSTKKNEYRINYWINNKVNNFSNLNSESFVILDDSEVIIYDNNHIKCDPKIGLTHDDVKKSLKLLKK